MTMIRIEKWNEFKSIVNEFNSSIQCVDHGNWYYLYIFRSGAPFYHIIQKTSPANSDQTDFESNYQANVNEILLGYKNIITGDGNDAHVTADNKLKVEASLAVSPTDAPGCPVITTKARIDHSETSVRINKVTESYTQIYNYSGSGKLYSTTLCLDDDDIIVKLTVDGEEIFDIDCDMLESLVNNDGHRSDILGWLRWDRSKNIITFKPDCPLVYSSSVLIEAKANNNSSSRDVDAYIICLTKET